jgi:hypothetical protein
MSDTDAAAESGKPSAHVADRKSESGAPDKRFVAQVVGNISLITAVLIYMGWAYENSLLEHFQIPAFSLGLSTMEYVLKGLVPLFRSAVVFIAVLVVAALTILPHCAVPARRLVPRPVRTAVGRVQPDHWVMIGGQLLVAVALPLTWSGQSTYSPGVFWFLLALLGAGSLLAAWPARYCGLGAVTYPLAMVVAAMCAFWAAGPYAASLGTGAAVSFANNLTSQTAVTVYSVQSLGLSGPDVDCAPNHLPGSITIAVPVCDCYMSSPAATTCCRSAGPASKTRPTSSTTVTRSGSNCPVDDPSAHRDGAAHRYRGVTALSQGLASLSHATTTDGSRQQHARPRTRAAGAITTLGALLHGRRCQPLFGALLDSRHAVFVRSGSKGPRRLATIAAGSGPWTSPGPTTLAPAADPGREHGEDS